ncbi:hypothetical protein K438DRAFT_1977429 [Mycena galopus ATCC 62051]|nr:hypothetical protein K438DRAFT_1977429 [Mycena galopus ATCC 62051]
MKSEKKRRKRKMRSLLPRPQPPPRAASPVASLARRRAPIAPFKTWSTTDWPSEAEASWRTFGEEVSEIASLWAVGDLGDETETADLEDAQQRAEREEEMERLWDRLMSQVLEHMSSLERRRFLREQREELEWVACSTYAEPLIADHSSSVSEYIDV